MPTVDDFLDSAPTSAADSFLDGDSADSFLDADRQSTLKASGNALAQEAVKGVGHALAGYGALTEIMPVSAGVGAAPSADDIRENIRRSRRTAAQVMTAIQQNPAVRMGQAIAAAAPEAYPVDSSRAQQFGPKAAGTVGSFLPLVASGPLAPATIGLQSLGAHLDEDWKQAKADGLTDEAAARRAMDRGLASGALQATLFLALPKPLRMAGEKYLVEKFGTSAVKEFLAGRVALGGEGAVLGGASTMAENVVGGRPLTQDVGAGAAGLGAFNLVLPPYFRGGRNRPADAIEGELLGKVPPRSAAQVERLPAAVTDAGLNEVVPTDLTTDIRRAPMPLAGDPPLRSESSVERLPAAVTDAGLNEVVPTDATTDIRVRPIELPEMGRRGAPPSETSSPERASQSDVARTAEAEAAPRGGGEPPRAIAPEARPPKAEVVTDPAQVQEIRNSITEGEQILSSGRSVVGRKMSAPELDAVRRSVENSKARIGETPQKPTKGTKKLTKAQEREQFEAEAKAVEETASAAPDLNAWTRERVDRLVASGDLEKQASGGYLGKTFVGRAFIEGVNRARTGQVINRGIAAAAKIQEEAHRKLVESYQPKATTPAAAVAKVQEHVAEVASGEKAVAKSEVRSQKSEVGTTTGPRPAKEIKSELVQRLEKELAKVPEPKFTQSKVVTTKGKKEFKIGIPERTDEIFQVREGRDGVWEVVKRGSSSTSVKGKTTTIPDKVLNTTGRYATPTEALRVAKATLEEYLYPDRAKTVTIEIPGDGTFTIKRTHYALSHTLERAQKLSTASAGRGAVRDERPGFNRDLWYQQARGGKARVDRLAKAQAAVEGRLREIKREGRVRALGDPEVGALRVAQGAIYILKGAKNFAEWSAQMVKRFGKEIEPALKDLWEQAKLVATGQHPTIGLSEHGIKTIANQELSDSVREAVNVHYAKLTDAGARTIANARIAEAGGPMPAVAKLMAGDYDAEPGKVQNAIAASVMRMLNIQEKSARTEGRESQADAIADAQVQVAQRSIDKSPDAGQTLQSFKLFYEQFSPAAWLRKFKKDIGQVAVTRTEAAIGKPVEPSPAGVAQGIADKVGEETAKRNPKLGRIIQEEFGTAGTAEGTARPVGETLADRLERTGRAAKGNGKAVADKISKFYQEEVGKFRRLHGIPAFDPATQRDILRRAKAIDALPEDSVQRREAALELMNHIRRLKGFQWWELPLDFWYANILSGPVTHLKNISGNAASLGAEVGMQIMRQPSALPSIIEALGRALPRGATEAANILRTGHDTASRHAGKFETHGALDAVTGTAGKLLLPWKLVGRALKAADVMFFYPLQETKGAVLASRASGLPIFNGERAAEVRRIMGWSEQARAKAAAQAKAEGLTGNTARRREYELLEQARPETLMESARDFAFHGTFNNDPYGVLGAVQRGFERTAREVPALKLIAPFTRIITNNTNSGMNWTPVGYWRAARAQGLKLLIGRETNTGKLYGRTISDPTAVGDAYARATVGSLALGGLAMAAGQYVFDRNPQFMVTGSGPADPDQRKLLRQTGWIPYSIKIGDRYYTYQDKTWAMPLGVVGHYLDAIRYRKLDQQDALNRAAFALSSSFNVIVQSSWLQGLSAIFDQAGRDSVKNPLKALPSQALRTASSFVVPNALRQVDQMFDPTRYTADDIQAMMLAQLPLARRENRPDLNVFGEPVAAPLSKTFLSKVEGDGLTRMLAARRLWPGVPADPYLTPAQTYALVKYRGPQLRAELLANYADLATLPHAEANALLARLSRDATVQAKKDLGLDTLSGIEKQVSKFNER